MANPETTVAIYVAIAPVVYASLTYTDGHSYDCYI